MQHNVTLVALAVDTDVDTGLYATAVNDPSGTTTNVDLDPADIVALITDVGNVLGVNLNIPNTSLRAGDTIVVVGSSDRIPTYQVGMMLTVDVDGWCHLVNAGVISNAITAALP